MTGSLWQTLVVAVVLAVAVFYLICIAVKKRRAGGGCANCVVGKGRSARQH